MATDAALRVSRRPFLRWSEAWWVSNVEVEAVVVPSIARIMRFGRPHGPNALWTSPDAERFPAGGWINWGGDKIWFWPQTDWPRDASGNGWPPPQDGFAASVEPTSDGLAWTLRGLPLFPAVEIHRSIHLPARGTRMRVQTRSLGAGASPRPWSVTQIPCPASVNVGSLRGGGAWISMSDPPTSAPERDNESWLLKPDPRCGSKYGFAAAELSADTPAGRFTISTEQSSQAEDGAQVCFDAAKPGNRPPDTDRYAELEFAAPEGCAHLVQWWSLG